jgi:hypothetical protein
MENTFYIQTTDAKGIVSHLRFDGQPIEAIEQMMEEQGYTFELVTEEDFAALSKQKQISDDAAKVAREQVAGSKLAILKDKTKTDQERLAVAIDLLGVNLTQEAADAAVK